MSAAVLKIEALDAKHGDCLLVHWDGRRTMLIDGGPHGVYEDVLRVRLAALGRVDVVCVSHVDDDHITGIERLLTEQNRAHRAQLALPLQIDRLWHNTVEALVDAAEPGLSARAATVLDAARHADGVVAATYRQGDAVTTLGAALGLDRNEPFNGPLLCGATAVVEGLEVTVAGPDRKSLDDLAAEWRAATDRDDPSVIATAYRDRTVPNLSSIILHVRRGAHTALLTGDARGDRLLTGLEECGLVRPGGTLHCDVLKLPHHGSHRNAARSLFDRLTADHYVISADGVRHPHPSEATLEWLVESRDPSDEYFVHLTNPIPDAARTLQRLRQGRRFTIRTRDSAARGVSIELT
jgi:hypothetical protein